MRLMIAVICLWTTVAAADTPPQIPATPAAIEKVVYARPFTLEQGYQHDWRKERPQVTSGMLLVLKVNKDLVYPRQVAEPVLYVGEQTAERINHGYESGHVIALVPGDVDLAKTRIWFGTPDLPERVDANQIRSERTAAENAGIAPVPAKEAAVALERGGARVTLPDKHALLRDVIAPLIMQFSPQEKHLADAYRVPVIEREKKAAADDDGK